MLNTKKTAQNIITSILVLCAIASTGAVLYRVFVVQQPSSAIVSGHIQNWSFLVHNKTPVIGDLSAPVKIVEFSDYECPYCRAMETKLHTLIQGQADQFALIRYAFPLSSIHPDAYTAAIAAKCAGLQGIYGAYQSLLFENGAHLGKVNWVKLAGQAGVSDLTLFSSCVRQRKTANLVSKDLAIGKKLGIQATPTFIINGDLVVGEQPIASLRKLIKAKMDKKTGSLWDRLIGLL